MAVTCVVHFVIVLFCTSATANVVKVQFGVPALLTPNATRMLGDTDILSTMVTFVISGSAAHSAASVMSATHSAAAAATTRARVPRATWARFARRVYSMAWAGAVCVCAWGCDGQQ